MATYPKLKPIKDDGDVMQLWVGAATDKQEIKLVQLQKIIL